MLTGHEDLVTNLDFISGRNSVTTTATAAAAATVGGSGSAAACVSETEVKVADAGVVCTADDADVTVLRVDDIIVSVSDDGTARVFLVDTAGILSAL